MTQKPASNTIT